MSNINTSAQVTREGKLARIKKLHCIFLTSDSLDMDDVKAAMLGLMDHLKITFDHLEDFIDNEVKEASERDGRTFKNADARDSFREWLIQDNQELSEMDRFVDMEDFFFEHINNSRFNDLSVFAVACERYLIFNRFVG